MSRKVRKIFCYNNCSGLSQVNLKNITNSWTSVSICKTLSEFIFWLLTQLPGRLFSPSDICSSKGGPL